MSIDKTVDPLLVTALPYIILGCKFKKFIRIKLEDIFDQSMNETNKVRVKSHNIPHISSLAQSFSTHINYAAHPPVVYKKSGVTDTGQHYQYVLVAGHHRLEALKSLGYTHWIVAEYEFGLDGISFIDSVRSLQLHENDHDPALANSNGDIINLVSRMIGENSGLVQNNEDSIREYVNYICPNLHHATRGSVIKQIISQSGAYQDVVTYTAEQAYSWIREHTDYEYAGNLDTRRKQYGWTVLEGYEYEYVVSAMKKYHETNKESYFVCHTRAPTKKYDLEAKRDNMLGDFEQLEDSLKSIFEFYQKNGRFPWRVEGFLPQDHKAGEAEILLVE